MKACSKCKINKHESNFRTRRDRPCGVRSQCRACDLVYAKSERGKLAARKYRSTSHGKAVISKLALKYRHSYMGKISRARASRKYWLSVNGRNHILATVGRRRERKIGLDAQFTPKDAKLIYERFNYRCFNCQSIKQLQIDHHRPLSCGYGLTLNNAVLLCKSCNASKNDKMPEDFYTPKQLLDLVIILQNT